MIEQSDFHKLLASLLGPTVHKVKELEETHILIRVMHESGCLKEDGRANIRQFVDHCYEHKDGLMTLEDEIWDVLLYLKLLRALELDIEVASHASMQCP